MLSSLSLNSLLFEKELTLHFNNLKSLLQECFTPSLVEISTVVLEKKIFNTQPYSNFSLMFSPLMESWSFILTNLKVLSSFPLECFVPSLTEIGPVVLKGNFFKNTLPFLYSLLIISHLTSTNWKALSEECFVPGFVVIGPVVWGKNIFKSYNPILTIS